MNECYICRVKFKKVHKDQLVIDGFTPCIKDICLQCHTVSKKRLFIQRVKRYAGYLSIL